MFHILFILFYSKVMQTTDGIKLQHLQRDANEESGPFKIHKIYNARIQQLKDQDQWTENQIVRYAAYVKLNAKFMQRRPLGKLWSLFQEMATFISTRNTSQCKSYHQKLIAKHGSISKILTFFAHEIINFQAHVSIALNQLASKKKSQSQKQIKQDKQMQSKVEEGIEPMHKFMKFIPEIPDPIKKPDDNDPTRDGYQSAENQWHAAMKTIKHSANAMFTSALLEDVQFSSETSVGQCMDKKRKQWIECHTIFLMWASKLNKLVCSP